LLGDRYRRPMPPFGGDRVKVAPFKKLQGSFLFQGYCGTLREHLNDRL
jgi:hypothetical protein